MKTTYSAPTPINIRIVDDFRLDDLVSSSSSATTTISSSSSIPSCHHFHMFGKNITRCPQAVFQVTKLNKNMMNKSSSVLHGIGNKSTTSTAGHSTVSILVVMIVAISILAVLLVIKFARYVFTKHTSHFAGKRLSRSHGKCQSTSTLDPPALRSWNTFTTQQQQIQKITSKIIHNNTHRRVLVTKYNAIKTNNDASSSSSAKEHDMDHVHLNYFQLLWAFIFVGPASYFLWKKATFILKLRVFLVETMGWQSIKKTVTSLEEVVGKLVLEQSQVIYYVGQRKATREDHVRDGAKIASFLYPDFPMVDINGKFKIANHLSVEIDLETKKMVRCNLDDESLNASEALILLWYNTISAQHVKVHAYGNWGVNPTKEMKDVNPFYERSSVVSVVYNYFGFTSFPTFMDSWKKEGLLSKDWDPTALTDTFVHGVKENICEHSNITELLPYSEMVEFITKTRWIFHNEFRKHKDLFPGVNAEGLFAATVLHSLDHELMEWNLDEPLWLDVKDPRFGKMAELGRIVRVGFVPQVPGYSFHRFFKGSGHPFFDAVYAKASKVNKKMADCLETCICR